MRSLIPAVALALVASSTLNAQTWRTLDVSRQLHDSAEHQITVRYSAGKLTLRPTSDPVLFAMQVRYDEEHTRPIYRYDAESRSATLGAEGEGRWLRRYRDTVPEMRLDLSRSVPMDLYMELGATQARLDAGGLTIRSLRLATGAADAVLDFSEPNRTEMRTMRIEVGAAGFVVTNLGNANVSRIYVNGGIGSVDLDFGGNIRRDVDVEANVALGKLSLHLPEDVGVRVELKRFLAGFEHPRLERRGDAFYSDNWNTASVRMRVRAETVFGAVQIERDR